MWFNVFDKIKNLNNKNETFNIFLISEGYQNEDKSLFINTCKKLYSRLRKTFPFSLLTDNTSFNLRFHMDFQSSKNFGPSIIDENEMGRTLFDSKLDPPIGVIKFDNNKFLEYYNDIKSILPYYINDSNSLFLILIPEIEMFKFGGEYMDLIKYNKENLLVMLTTTTGHWEQVIINSIGKLIGLGVEYECEGIFNLSPESNLDGYLIDNMAHNLIYLDDTMDTNSIIGSKWKVLSPIADQVSLISTFLSDSHPEFADFSLPKYNYSSEKIEIWEGAGGYRTKLYRSARDCIMRRKIGDKNLPLRMEKLPLCPVCEAIFRQALFSCAGFNTGIITYFPGN